MFAVEAKDGKWGVVNRSGTFIYKCTYYKAQITGDLIRLQATANEEPKFYNVKTPTTEIKVTRVDANAFSPEIQSAHRRMEAKALEIAIQDPMASFGFQPGTGGRQALYVDGEKLFEAKTWSLISTYEYYKESATWVFIVQDRIQGRDVEGVYGLNIYMNENTGRGHESYLIVPMEYSYIGPASDMEHAVKCITFSGAPKYFTWSGNPILPTTGNSASNASAQQATQNVNSSSNVSSPVEQQAENRPEADVSKEVYDRKFTPEVKAEKANITIKEIAIGKNYTRLKMVYVADNMADCFFLYRPYDPRGFRIEANGKTYYMVAQKGMKYRDEGRTCVNIKESLTFYLYFEALPDDVKKMNVLEEAAVIGVWEFYNMELKNKKKGFFDKLNDALDQVDEVLDQVDKAIK
jgi:hypothetical protein